MPLTGLSVNEDNFLPEMREELGIIASEVESYNEELSLLRSMSTQFMKYGNQKLYSYLSGYNHLISEADALYAENALRSEYWKRVMALTDVLSVMSDEKRTNGTSNLLLTDITGLRRRSLSLHSTQ